MKRLLGLLIAAVGVLRAEVSFQKAEPVWLEGRAEEMNVQAGFSVAFDAVPGAVLRMTGATMCRIFLNGEFFGYGPARGPHGCVRVDEWPLDGKLKAGRNVLAIEVAGYNANSYYTLKQPSFLQAEIVAGGKVVAATGTDGAFRAVAIGNRVQKVPRYTYQRPFSEVWELAGAPNAWRKNVPENGARLEKRPQPSLLPRIVPFPTFSERSVQKVVSTGSVAVDTQAKGVMNRALTCVEDKGMDRMDGYHFGELSIVPYQDVCRMKNATQTPVNSVYAGEGLALAPDGYAIVDLGLNDTGFTKMTIEAKEPATVYFVFDEVLNNDDVNIQRMKGCNVQTWIAKEPGVYDVEAFEPMTWRYAKIVARGGNVVVSKLGMREYKNPETSLATFEASDKSLEKIFEAARETFMQNAVDGFMDCPSRERAGWLCDSFFTGRANADFTGNAKQERIFLQNFLMPAEFPHLPKGVLPMCYPSDHINGRFIPNWDMWMMIELEEYLHRTGDRELVDAFKDKALAFVDYLHTFRNSDGLLEKLPSWVFIEWSHANKLVQDVSYPSNMTWSDALGAIARLYDLPELAKESEQVKETIRKQSWNGKFFVDNATRQSDGTLKLSGESTETCQYYAFFHKIATPATHPELWARLRDDFGPKRKTTKAWPQIAFSNAFIGNYLRLECLAQEGLAAQMLDETKGYFLYMAERTGTLWENDSTVASCNHGFASHVAHSYYRDLLGVKKCSIPEKKIELHFNDVPLSYCKGTIPMAGSVLKVEWKREGKAIVASVNAPEGYKVSTSAAAGLDLKIK